MAFTGSDQRIWKWLESIGVFGDASNTQRVIIDIPVDDVVRVYVTKCADERMFDLSFPDGIAEIVTVPKPETDEVADATTLASDGTRSFEAPATED